MWKLRVKQLRVGMLKFFFLIFDSRNQKFDFFRLSFISRREKLVQTGDKYGWWVRLCVVNALTFCWWSRLHLGLAILFSCVCIPSTATVWRAEQLPGVSWLNDCCDDVQALISYGETKQTSKGIPPPPCYVVVQLISRENSCRYHWRANWKRHAETWNLTLIDETGSVFSKQTSKPPIARSQFRRLYAWLYAYRIPHRSPAAQ